MEPLEFADVVALLEAYLRRDEEAMTALTNAVGDFPLLAGLLGWVERFVGEDRLRALVHLARQEADRAHRPGDGR